MVFHTASMMKTLEKEAHRVRFGQVLLFRALSLEAQNRLFEAAEVHSFGNGDVVIHEGDTSPCFFAVLQGAVVVEVRQKDKDVYICTLGPGEVFGEAALFLKSSRTASIRVTDSAVLARLDRESWMDFLRAEPREGNKALLAVIYGLMSKLRSANQELAFERRDDAAQAEVDALLAELNVG